MGGRNSDEGTDTHSGTLGIYVLCGFDDQVLFSDTSFRDTISCHPVNRNNAFLDRGRQENE